jgi:hypothetical protein
MITISGTLEIQDNNMQQHTISATDFSIDNHFDGTTVSFVFDTGGRSVERIAENKNGAISYDDWTCKNCMIVKDNTSFR